MLMEDTLLEDGDEERESIRFFTTLVVDGGAADMLMEDTLVEDGDDERESIRFFTTSSP